MSEQSGMLAVGTVNPDGRENRRPLSDETRQVIAFPTTHLSGQAIGASDVMRHLFLQTHRVAHSSAPILITGESGTGKEVIARLIHQASRRGDRKYVRVNCAALSESLIESELFGHERGAFTGAVDHRIGRFEWAADGTILLDEISEIPVQIQAKLLRVLEEEEFQRVGSNESRPMSARIIATSNRSLLAAVADGTFREDLYYRLNVLQFHVPPLRERRLDIIPLVKHFVQMFRDEDTAIVERFSERALDTLRRYDWPGNVRQLRNVVRRVCILGGSKVAQIGDLPPLPASTEMTEVDIFRMTLKDASRTIVHACLQRLGGNKTAAARQLGITTRTLHNWIKQDPDLAQPNDRAA